MPNPDAQNVILKLLVLVICPILLISCTTRTYTMPTSGMRPTIVAGDRVTIDHQAYSRAAPRIGDIVMFTPIHQPDHRWIFRIAGVPGDTLVYKQGTLMRNGKPLPSPVWQPPRFYSTVNVEQNPLNSGAITIPVEHYFLLSDDPSHLNDSRAWGLIPLQNIQGKVISTGR